MTARSNGTSALPSPIRRDGPDAGSITQRRHSRVFPAPIRMPTTPPRNRQWVSEIDTVYLDVGDQQYAVSWSDWIAYVRRRLKRPAVCVRHLTVATVRYPRVRVQVFTGSGRRLRDEVFYDHVPSNVLVKRIDRIDTINWARELDEIDRRTRRAPFLADERRRAEARSKKYSVPRNTLGYLYMMQRHDGGPVKIGFALDVDRRRRKLQEQYTCRLIVLQTLWGTPSDEFKLHRHLIKYRLPFSEGVGHEWYHDAKQVRMLFRKVDRGGLQKRSRRYARGV